MESILKLCSRGILLNLGEVVLAGDIRTVLAEYSDRKLYASKSFNLDSLNRAGDCLNRARLIKIVSLGDHEGWSFPFGRQLTFDLWVESRVSVNNVELAIGLF